LGVSCCVFFFLFTYFLALENDAWFWRRVEPLCRDTAEDNRPRGWWNAGSAQLPNGQFWEASPSCEAVELVWIYWRAIAGEQGCTLTIDADGAVNLEGDGCRVSIHTDGNTYQDEEPGRFDYPSPFDKARLLELTLEAALEAASNGALWREAKAAAVAAYERHAREYGFIAGAPLEWELWKRFHNDYMSTLTLVSEHPSREDAEKGAALRAGDVVFNSARRHGYVHEFFVVERAQRLVDGNAVFGTPVVSVCEMCGARKAG
jgi:hypothetical protein